MGTGDWTCGESLRLMKGITDRYEAKIRSESGKTETGSDSGQTDEGSESYNEPSFQASKVSLPASVSDEQL